MGNKLLTIDHLRNVNGLHNIPKRFTVHQNICLDYKLSDDILIDGVFDFDIFLPKYGVNLQRPYVWENYQASEFLISILLEKPISDFVLIKHIDDRKRLEQTTKYLVIDGKQRLLTIKKFLLGEIQLEIGNEKYSFNDLDSDLKTFFLRRLGYMTATVYYSYFDMPITDDMKITLFNFYNFAGTPQTVEHKQMLQKLLEK